MPLDLAQPRGTDLARYPHSVSLVITDSEVLGALAIRVLQEAKVT